MDCFEVKPILKKGLVDFLQADSTIPSEIVVVNSLTEQETAFPRIVFAELNINTNSYTLDYEEYVKMLMYQVDIFCKGSAAEPQCRRIAKSVNTYLEKTMHLNQRNPVELKQEDASSKRYTITYVGKFNETRGKFV